MIITENHERFINIFDQYIHRDGAAALLDWMEKRTDFFEAPASTKFHGACKEAPEPGSLDTLGEERHRENRF